MKKIIFAIVIHAFFFSSANASDIDKVYIKEEKIIKLIPLNENDIEKERKKLNSDLKLAEFNLNSALETVRDHKKNIENCLKNSKSIPSKIEENVKLMVDNFDKDKYDKNTSIGVLYKIGAIAEYCHILKQKNNHDELQSLLQEAEQAGFIDELRMILHLSKNEKKKLSNLYLKFKEFQKIFNRIGVNVEKVRLKAYGCELVIILWKEDIDCKIYVEEIRSDEDEIITEEIRKSLETVVKKVKNDKLEIDRVINLVLSFCIKNQIRLAEVEEYNN